MSSSSKILCVALRVKSLRTLSRRELPLLRWEADVLGDTPGPSKESCEAPQSGSPTAAMDGVRGVGAGQILRGEHPGHPGLGARARAAGRAGRVGPARTCRQAHLDPCRHRRRDHSGAGDLDHAPPKWRRCCCCKDADLGHELEP